MDSKMHLRIMAAGIHPLRGICLAEVLISLALTGILTTALASSVTAISQSWKTNYAYAQTMQPARIAMHRMLTAVRQSAQCQIGENAPLLGQTQVTDTSTLRYITTAGTAQAFRLTGTTLMYYPNDTGISSVGSTLAHNVSGVTFSAQMDPVSGSVLNVQIRLTIKPPPGSPAGAANFFLIDSAVPRRNLLVQ